MTGTAEWKKCQDWSAVRRCPSPEVHVWRVELEPEPATASALELFLSADELDRANRFRFGELRRRWVVARGALRSILASYTGVAPRSILFNVGPYGKPMLARSGAAIAFNLSHSKHLALIAVTKAPCVGIDVEVVRPELPWHHLSQQFFSPSEIEEIRALAPNLRADAFFACWTRKEAFIKALGIGLSMALDSFRVTVQPHAPARLLWIKGDQDAPLRWHLENLSECGVAAALAVPEPSAVVRRFAFAPLAHTNMVSSC